MVGLSMCSLRVLRTVAVLASPTRVPHPAPRSESGTEHLLAVSASSRAVFRRARSCHRCRAEEKGFGRSGATVVRTTTQRAPALTSWWRSAVVATRPHPCKIARSCGSCCHCRRLRWPRADSVGERHREAVEKKGERPGSGVTGREVILRQGPEPTMSAGPSKEGRLSRWGSLSPEEWRPELETRRSKPTRRGGECDAPAPSVREPRFPTPAQLRQENLRLPAAGMAMTWCYRLRRFDLSKQTVRQISLQPG